MIKHLLLCICRSLLYKFIVCIVVFRMTESRSVASKFLETVLFVFLFISKNGGVDIIWLVVFVLILKTNKPNIKKKFANCFVFFSL